MIKIECKFTEREIEMTKAIAKNNKKTLDDFHHIAIQLGFWSCDKGRSAWIKECIPPITNDTKTMRNYRIRLEEWESISVDSYSHEHGVKPHEFVRSSIIMIIIITKFLDMWILLLETMIKNKKG